MRTSEKLNKGQLITFLRDKLGNLYSKFQVSFSYLSGSWADGLASWWSDIDVFLSIPTIEKHSKSQQSSIILDINVDAYFLTNLEELNISILELLPLHVQHNVIKKGYLLYQRNIETRCLYLEKLYHRYFDHKIWYEDYLNQSLEVV